MSGPAFVAGATGYVGRAVVAALRGFGVPTRAHVRPDSARLDDWRARFAALGAETDTTPWARDALAEALRAHRPGLVFSLLGTTRARTRADAAAGAAAGYEAVDYGLTVMLLEACVAAGHRPRFVYLSAAGVGPKARGAYMSARWRVEAAVRASGLPWTIARPSFIVGADRDQDRPMERLGASLVDGLLGVAGALGARRLADRYRSIGNVPLAEALVARALAPAGEGDLLEGGALRRA